MNNQSACKTCYPNNPKGGPWVDGGQDKLACLLSQGVQSLLRVGVMRIICGVTLASYKFCPTLPS